MELFRPLETIKGLENICEAVAQVVHDGQQNETSDFYTRKYRFWTSSIDYTDVKFIYNHRYNNGEGQFSVKFAIEGLLDLLVHIKNRNGTINLPNMRIVKDGKDIKVYDQ
jgi:hypothetical protein